MSWLWPILVWLFGVRGASTFSRTSRAEALRCVALAACEHLYAILEEHAVATGLDVLTPEDAAWADRKMREIEYRAFRHSPRLSGAIAALRAEPVTVTNLVRRLDVAREILIGPKTEPKPMRRGACRKWWRKAPRRRSARIVLQRRLRAGFAPRALALSG